MSPSSGSGGGEDRSRPTLGLALGGGAVLGFAHIGLLSALDEANVEIDCIAGTSAGAIAAGLYAFGVSPDRLRDLLSPLTWRKVSGFTRTSKGLLTNEPVGELVIDELGDAQIEDAEIPLAVVAADIHTGERIVLRDGPLDLAVRASAAIPGIYTPVAIGDRVLVDGGIVDNVPVEAVRELGAEIAVAATLGDALDFDEVSNLLSVLTNAFLITVNNATRLSLELDRADVVIQPDLEPHNHWDMKQRDELMEKGYQAGRDAVSRIRDALEKAASGGG
ncbi:MAG: patatin-like phospholipase family protein [Longimicrobiales bacterium]|nr:patatin-like phospholipase family protein [Longimicrobiales bacterium]